MLNLHPSLPQFLKVKLSKKKKRSLMKNIICNKPSSCQCKKETNNKSKKIPLSILLVVMPKNNKKLTMMLKRRNLQLNLKLLI